MHAARNLLDRAAALLPADDRRRLSLLTSLGRVLEDAGELERADAVLSEAVESGRAAGERGVTADAGVALSFARLYRSSRSDKRRSCARLTPRFLSSRSWVTGPALARALGAAGTVRYWRGEVQAAAEDLERSAQYAREVGDRAQEALSLEYVLLGILEGPTPADRALERVEEIRSAHEDEPAPRG